MRALPAVRIGFMWLAAFGLSLVAALALTAQADDVGLRDRVIVMNSGRILTGQMTRNAGGWLVEQANGRVQVPEDQVKLVAKGAVFGAVQAEKFPGILPVKGQLDPNSNKYYAKISYRFEQTFFII